MWCQAEKYAITLQSLIITYDTGEHRVYLFIFSFPFLSLAITPREQWGNVGSRGERVTWGRGEQSQ